MASFEELLMETMPFAGAETAYRAGSLAQPATDDEQSATTLPVEIPSLFGGDTFGFDNMKVIRLELGESWNIPSPVIEPSDYETPENVNIWQWQHDANEPWKITDLKCRVRSSEYRSYKVLDTLEWGLEREDAKGDLKKCIRITTITGKRIELPLTKDFVTYKAVVEGGRIDKDQTDLWKLASNHDQSLVVAFVYALDFEQSTHAAGQARQFQPPRVMTADEANDLGDDFMPSGGAAAATGAEVHGEASAYVDQPRVIVILSLTTCKQGEDFAPGSIVGMGRVYPHIMVMSNTPLTLIEGTVRLNRPEESPSIEHLSTDVVIAPDDLTKPLVNFFKGPLGCCSEYDDHGTKIGSVLFADANDFGISALNSPPLPFWSNFFAYYLIDPFDQIGNKSVQAVSRYVKKDGVRTDVDSLVMRQPVTGPADYGTLIKMPWQGEFDNIHMAPKMKLGRKGYKQVRKALHVERTGRLDRALPGDRPVPQLQSVEVPLDILPISEISMAPFCSHDCFHTHWRWGQDAKDPAQCGFDGMVPYAKPGAPLIPGNQSLLIWLRAPNLLTYTAIAWAHGTKPIPANTWQVIMHHGSAFAVDVTAFMLAFLAKFSVEVFGGQPSFYSDDNATTPILSTMSFSLFYWRLRWETVLVDGRPQLRERIVAKDLKAARDL